MRNLIYLGVLLASGLLAASSHAAIVFSATLNGSQEVPANASLATGTASLTLNDAQTRLEMSLTINGVDFTDQGGTDTAASNVTIFHIHRNIVGMNGPVVFGLIGPNNDANNDLVITPFAGGATVFSAWDAAEGNGTTLTAELNNLLAGGLYFNVHTVAFPGGEIRGQISQVPEPSSLVLLGAIMLPLAWRRAGRN